MKCSPLTSIAFIVGALTTLRDVYTDLSPGGFSLSGAAHGLGRTGWGRAESLRVELAWLSSKRLLVCGLSQIYMLTPKGTRIAEKLVRRFNRERAREKALA